MSPSINTNLSARKSPRPCPVCDSTGSRTVLHQQRFFEGPLGEGYDVVVCDRCGAGFADGIPAQEIFDRYYAEQSKYTYAHAGGAESQYDFRRFERIADQLEAHLPSKGAHILDIGCATGGLLSVLKRRGYTNLLGSDPSAACATAARQLYNVDVRTVALREHASWPEKFDAVLLIGVLEHLREAREAVRIVAGLLRPGGIIYCAQPDVEAFAACANAPYQQFSTEHVNFFSRDSMTRLMAENGLAPQAFWRWMVEWREGMTDSVVSGVFARGQEALAGDAVTGPALREYLVVSAAQEAETLRHIEKLVQTQAPVLVWGAGTLTRRLLAIGALGRANVIAFVDANPAFAGKSLAGRQVLSPTDLTARGETILICSRVFEAEIRRMIRDQLKLPNVIQSLFPPTG
jgi:SAM-dependent methyltransferase